MGPPPGSLNPAVFQLGAASPMSQRKQRELPPTAARHHSLHTLQSAPLYCSAWKEIKLKVHVLRGPVSYAAGVQGSPTTGSGEGSALNLLVPGSRLGAGQWTAWGRSRCSPGQVCLPQASVSPVRNTGPTFLQGSFLHLKKDTERREREPDTCAHSRAHAGGFTYTGVSPWVRLVNRGSEMFRDLSQVTPRLVHRRY